MNIKSCIKFQNELDSSHYSINHNSVEFNFTGFGIPLLLHPGRYKLEAYGASGGGSSIVQSMRQEIMVPCPTLIVLNVIFDVSYDPSFGALG